MVRIIRKAVFAIAALSITPVSGAIAAPLAEGATPAFTEAQAKAGEAEYIANCVDCHGKHLNDGEFGGPPLVGQAFRDKWGAQPATNLARFIASAMPPEAPGRLPAETYAEIVAYILSVNADPAKPAAPTPP